MDEYINKKKLRDALYDADAVTFVGLKIIDQMPPANVAPVVHGEWIQGGYACGETEWKCSNCGETEWRTSCNRMKYCMFCGAKMDGHTTPAYRMGQRLKARCNHDT